MVKNDRIILLYRYDVNNDDNDDNDNDDWEEDDVDFGSYHSSSPLSRPYVLVNPHVLPLCFVFPDGCFFLL